MMVDTTVYGYVGDGDVYCPACVERDDDGNVEDADLGRIYGTDDTSAEGLSCGGCGEYIFEPDYSGAWSEAIQDIVRYGRAATDGDWRVAERILALFIDAGFEPEGKLPDR